MQLVFFFFHMRLLATEKAAVIVSMSARGSPVPIPSAESEIIPAAHFRIGNETDFVSVRWESLRIIRIFRNNPENGSGLHEISPCGRRGAAVRPAAFDGNSIEFGTACRATYVREQAHAICRRDYKND
ncbi:hypothetical protein [Burkholderia sp. Bp8963]|uniref:hypothetical protein n=1 Tax=Burkholderia sp. Bp8963 TaxID=2184547 RepID=UPI000F5B5558|nr:hypothetical protein [Burkholderia sp. Bp8963]